MFGRDTMKIEAMAGLAFVALLIAVSTPLADDTTRSKDDIERIEKFKAAVLDGVETRRKLGQVMNDTVFSFGELAYQEFETSKHLTSLLEKNGFSVERGDGRHAHRLGRALGLRPSGHCARERYRLPSESLAEARRRLSRAAGRKVPPAMARATIQDRRSTSSRRSRSRT